MNKGGDNSVKLCIWGKIKEVLISSGVKNKDKSVYKEKIGNKLIRDNKLLVREYLMWCDIFNGYKQKLPLFYSYAKSYKNIFKEINLLLSEINKKIQMDNETFKEKIVNFVYKYTSSQDFKEILEILNCDMFSTEYSYDDVKFSSNINGVELTERNIYNVDYIVNLLASENTFFEKEVNKIKTILDKMTDLCESSAILDINTLKKFKEFLEGHQNYIVKNIND